MFETPQLNKKPTVKSSHLDFTERMVTRILRKKSEEDDCTNTVNTIVDNLAEKNPNSTPRRVWMELKKIDKQSSTWIGMAEMKVMSTVKHIRCQALDKYVFRMIEQSHEGKTKDSKFWFLQFNMSVINQYAN